MKIGIYAPWASGDMAAATACLKYKGTLWPGAQIVWFVLPPERAGGIHAASPDIVAHNPIPLEMRSIDCNARNIVNVRKGHRENNEGHPLSVVDRSLLGQLSEKRNKFRILDDLDLCFFPVPWANCDKLDGPFVLAQKAAINYSPEMQIRPFIGLTPEEKERGRMFVSSLPYETTVMLETKCGSNQSNWNDRTTSQVMRACRETRGACNFIFGSPGSQKGFEGKGVVDCSSFTLRQCVAIYNHCDLLASTASGIAVITSAWQASPRPRRIEYTNNPRITTSPISMSPTSTVSSETDLLSQVRRVLQR